MACMTLFAASVPMATTELTRAVRYEESFTWQEASSAVEHQPLSMSWVVVTDGNGDRRLTIQWIRSADHA